MLRRVTLFERPVKGRYRCDAHYAGGYPAGLSVRARNAMGLSMSDAGQRTRTTVQLRSDRSVRVRQLRSILVALLLAPSLIAPMPTAVYGADCERSPDAVLRQALQAPEPHQTIVVGTVLSTEGLTARLAVEVLLHGETQPVVNVRDHDVEAIRAGFEPGDQYAVVIVRRDDGVLVTSRCQGTYQTDPDDVRELLALAPNASFIERDETTDPATTLRLAVAGVVVALGTLFVVLVMRRKRGRSDRRA